MEVWCGGSAALSAAGTLTEHNASRTVSRVRVGFIVASPFDSISFRVHEDVPRFGLNKVKLGTAPCPSYLQEDVAILELANRAAELFEKQSGSEKRRLLDFVLSNSTWGDGQLTVEFRQTFDLIALGTTELKQKKAAGVGSDDLYQLKYTPLDSNQ